MKRPKAPIAYEYGGNCCSQISFDQEKLTALMQIIGGPPRRTLIIREGNERRGGFVTIPLMHQGWPRIFPFLERRRPLAIEQTEVRSC